MMLIVLRGVREVGVVRWGRVVGEVSAYVLVALVVPLPWFIFSYFHTGNPVYPFLLSCIGWPLSL